MILENVTQKNSFINELEPNNSYRVVNQYQELQGIAFADDNDNICVVSESYENGKNNTPIVYIYIFSSLDEFLSDHWTVIENVTDRTEIRLLDE